MRLWMGPWMGGVGPRASRVGCGGCEGGFARWLRLLRGGFVCCGVGGVPAGGRCDARARRAVRYLDMHAWDDDQGAANDSPRCGDVDLILVVVVDNGG